MGNFTDELEQRNGNGAVQDMYEYPFLSTDYQHNHNKNKVNGGQSGGGAAGASNNGGATNDANSNNMNNNNMNNNIDNTVNGNGNYNNGPQCKYTHAHTQREREINSISDLLLSLSHTLFFNPLALII